MQNSAVPQQSPAAAPPPGKDADSDIENRKVPSWLLDLGAVSWTLVVALVMLGPAISRGWELGSYLAGSGTGLLTHQGVAWHGTYVNADLVDTMVPWTNLSWLQVHHGVLPLWNPYNGEGMPLAFNWQSASFSVPTMVAYLFPLKYAFAASVVTTFVIAGTGAYVLGRVLGLGVMASLMTATVFELGGPMTGWLGYPNAQVGAWGGWLLAAAVLVVRGRHRIRSVVLLAVVLACAVYAGQPETLAMTIGALTVFCVTMLALRAAPNRWGFSGGPIRVPALDLGCGLAAGLGLAAPLLLPAAQLTTASVRLSNSAPRTLSLSDLPTIAFSSFDGVPVPGQFAFGSATFYEQTAAYVGIIAVVLALIGVVRGWRKRSASVAAVVAVTLVCGAEAFFNPFARAMQWVPVVGQSVPERSLLPLSLALAVLAGFGLDALRDRSEVRFARAAMAYGFTAAAVVLAVLWTFGRGQGIDNIPKLTPLWHSTLLHIRSESFRWPVGCVVAALGAIVVLWWRPRSARAMASFLLVAETLFLVTAGSIQVGSSPNGLAPTPAILMLKRDIGAASVGTGPNPGCGLLGISPDINITYAVHEVLLYDPLVPTNAFVDWRRREHSIAGSPLLNLFCPPIRTAAEARLLGVAYVLDARNTPGPTGGVPVAVLPVPDPAGRGLRSGTPSLADEVLYKIPGAGRFTELVEPHPGPAPAPDASGVVLPVDEANPAHLTFRTANQRMALVRLHLTDVPGWSAMLDGRPLALRRIDGWMLQARVPAGRHLLAVTYWPPLFSLGLAAALGTVLVLGTVSGVQVVRQRLLGNHSRRRREPDARRRA